jgi:2'-5' RNA ligase
MRLFTAIIIPTEVKNKLTEVVRGKLPISYINTANLHVTLNFLGEIDQKKIETIKNVLNNTQSHPIKIEFDQVKKVNRQIHLAVKKTGELMELQSSLETKLKDLGFHFQDRSYYPHVKLANLHMDNIMFPDRKLENFPNHELQVLNFTAYKITLFESELLPRHAKHTILAEKAL